MQQPKPAAIVGHMFPPFDLSARDAIRAAAEGVKLPPGDH
jgi:hypothetical protein